MNPTVYIVSQRLSFSEENTQKCSRNWASYIALQTRNFFRSSRCAEFLSATYQFQNTAPQGRVHLSAPQPSAAQPSPMALADTLDQQSTTSQSLVVFRPGQTCSDLVLLSALCSFCFVWFYLELEARNRHDFSIALDMSLGRFKKRYWPGASLRYMWILITI